MQEQQSRYSIISVILATFLFTNVNATEFHADRLGGGPDDVLVNRLLLSEYHGRSSSDVVYPDDLSGGFQTYTIQADVAATATSFLSDVSEINVRPLGQSDFSAFEQNEVAVPEGISELRVLSPTEEVASPLFVDLSDSPYDLAITKRDFSHPQGTFVQITARVVTGNDGENDPEEIITEPSLPIENVVANVVVRNPDGSVRGIQNLIDNGANNLGDIENGDDVYSAKVLLNTPGSSEINISFKGQINGASFSRSKTVYSYYRPDRMQLQPGVIKATEGEISGQTLEDGRFGLPVLVTMTKGSMPDILNTRAVVYGKDERGNDAVVGWIGGLVQPIQKSNRKWLVPMSFHTEWLLQSHYQPPYRLDEITLKDVDTHDQLLHGNRAASITGLRASLSSRSVESKISGYIEPTQDMLRGRHPDLIGYKNSSSDKQKDLAITSRALNDNNPDVLFLHGWCTGEKPIGHFNPVIVGKALNYPFSDNGEAVDRYALDVMNWLGWRPGKVRGIVAHSHGGLVAAFMLQNFSYVFADNAQSRPPNVVSVGSPYHGTEAFDQPSSILEDMVENIVENFQGCTIPPELRPSTNNSFKSSIGWRARNQIRAFTTAHSRSRWYDRRNCGRLNSAIITGTDDGVIARTDGNNFADGGYSHHLKWCHTGELGGNQGDQWLLPEFVNAVNNTFFSFTEDWQPF